MANEAPTGPATNGIAHGTVPGSASAKSAPKKPANDRRSVPSGKGIKSPDERHADRAHVEKLAADLAAASAEAKEAVEQAAAESAAREAMAAELEATNTALASVRAELAAQVERASQPVIATQVRTLPHASETGPDGAEECVPPVVYTAAANEFRPFECIVLGVQAWPNGQTMIRARLLTDGKFNTALFTALHPYGPQTLEDGSVHERIQLESRQAFYVPVDGSLMGLAARFVRDALDPKGAHAIAAYVRPEVQIVTDGAGDPTVIHRAWILHDFGAGTVAKLDVDP